MALRDVRLFKLIFEPAGVLAQFLTNPTKTYVILGNRFFSKKATVRLLRHILPQYRVYLDDNLLIGTVYQNQAIDLNIKRLLTQDQPVLPEQAHLELERIDQLPLQQKERAQILWAESWARITPTADQKKSPLSLLRFIRRFTPSIPFELLARWARGLVRMAGNILARGLSLAGRLLPNLVGTMGGVILRSLGGLAGVGVGVLARVGVMVVPVAISGGVVALAIGVAIGSVVLLTLLLNTDLLPPFPPPSAEAAVLLDYALPLKDAGVSPQDIKTQVKNTFTGAKLEYWDNPIIKRSKEEGWNSALVLALWIEETGASQATLIKNGGSEIVINGALSKGHLGCAPAEDQTIDESLNCLFKFGASYTNDQFTQFMTAYSSGPPGNPFANNPNFPKNVKYWYSQLVPIGAGSLTPIIPTPVYTPALGAGAGIISCLVTNGRVTTGSKDAGGHCSPGYETDFPCAIPDITGRATAVDLESLKTDRSVFLPFINSQTVNWLIDKVGTDTDYVKGGVRVSGGFEVIARTEDGKYRIRFVHLESPNITQGQLASSGILVGLYRTNENHVHVTIQENTVYKPADLYFNLCQ